MLMIPCIFFLSMYDHLFFVRAILRWYLRDFQFDVKKVLLIKEIYRQGTYIFLHWDAYFLILSCIIYTLETENVPVNCLHVKESCGCAFILNHAVLVT